MDARRVSAKRILINARMNCVEILSVTCAPWNAIAVTVSRHSAGALTVAFTAPNVISTMTVQIATNAVVISRMTVLTIGTTMTMKTIKRRKRKRNNYG